MGDPSSMPDIAEGGRVPESNVRDVVLACPISTHGESGRTGERKDLALDLDWPISREVSVMLATLPFLLYPEVEALPFLPCVLGLPDVAHVMLEGVVGLEETEVIGWKAVTDNGERGRRRPSTGESMGSGVGEVLPLPLRSSGVMRPLGVRLKKRGDGDTGTALVGDVGREVREIEALELVRYMLEEKL